MTHDAGPDTTILLLGNYRPALAVARSLKRSGFRVAVSRDSDAGAASWSRCVDEVWDTPETGEPSKLYDALGTYLREHPEIRIVFPLMESYVRNFYSKSAALPKDRIYIMPNREAVETCLDKDRLLGLVAEKNIPSMRSVETTDHAGLRQAALDVGFPLVVKPADSTIWLNGRKALIVRSRDDFTSMLPAWPDGHDSLLVQQFVDGPRVNLYFAAQRGVPVRCLAVEIARTDIADGTGLATSGQTVPVSPELEHMVKTLIAALSYHGVGCLQVLLEGQDRQPVFLEINPRIGGNHAITEFAGLGLAQIALQLAQKERVDSARNNAPCGLRYVWTTGDLRGHGHALRSGETSIAGTFVNVARAVWRGLKTRNHVTFAIQDPMPSIVLLTRLLKGLGR